MVNEEQLGLIKKGVSTWNEWIRKNADAEIMPEIDLSGADLRGADLSVANLSMANLSDSLLSGANLSVANLSNANLSGANLSYASLNDANFSRANLSGAILSGADLREADFSKADLRGANLSKANLIDAYLSETDLSGTNLSMANLNQADIELANFSGANLSRADLTMANLTGANLTGANLSGGIMVRTILYKANLKECRIYGISAWDLKLQETLQLDLIITPYGESVITVDNLEVAQFVYLLLKNEKIRDVIDTIGKKGVLILGRFTPERKIVLDAIRNELRRLNYAPIIFDFEKPTNKDFTETIMTLAGMCRFIIVDITNPKSSPLELQATVPNYMIPFVPIIQQGEEPFSMFKDLSNKYEWILDTLEYDSVDNLVNGLEKAVVKPALKKHEELMIKKAEGLRKRYIKDY